MDPASLLIELSRHLESQIPGHFPEFPPALSETELARGLFERQVRLNPAFRRLCPPDALNPDAIADLSDIPVVPVAAFKELEITTIAATERAAVFHSSGTSEQKPSRHFHSVETLGIYRLAIEGWFKRHWLMDQPWAGERRRPLPEERLPFLSLTPDRTAAPHSSLVFMIDALIGWYGSAESRFAGVLGNGGWEVDGAALRATLEQWSSNARPRPVVLLGTAFSFVHLLDELDRAQVRLQLPPGSRVMETGGYKGRSRTVPKPELHAMISHGLGVPHAQIISEYGMSELSSQAYDAAIGSGPGTGAEAGRRVFQFPPWCRVTLTSPETGRPLEAGEGDGNGEAKAGLLCVHDLANVASAIGIQTEDLARRAGEGFELLGRAAQAEPRGCSLMPVEGRGG